MPRVARASGRTVRTLHAFARADEGARRACGRPQQRRGRFVSVPDRPFSRERVLHLLREFAPPNFGVKLSRPGFGPAAELPTSSAA